MTVVQCKVCGARLRRKRFCCLPRVASGQFTATRVVCTNRLFAADLPDPPPSYESWPYYHDQDPRGAQEPPQDDSGPNDAEVPF